MQIRGEKLADRMVDRWQDALRWWSMWMHAIGTTCVGLFLMVPSMPHEVQQALPAETRALLIAVWAVAGIAARLIKQNGKAG